MFIAHSVVLKYFTFTLAGTAQYFASIGLPAFLAYVVFALEAVGGVLLVLGIGTRWVALGLVPVLLGATWVHVGNGWVFSAPNGGWEYPLFLIVISWWSWRCRLRDGDIPQLCARVPRESDLARWMSRSYGSSRSPSGGGTGCTLRAASRGNG